MQQRLISGGGLAWLYGAGLVLAGIEFFLYYLLTVLSDADSWDTSDPLFILGFLGGFLWYAVLLFGLLVVMAFIYLAISSITTALNVWLSSRPGRYRLKLWIALLTPVVAAELFICLPGTIVYMVTEQSGGSEPAANFWFLSVFFALLFVPYGMVCLFVARRMIKRHDNPPKPDLPYPVLHDGDAALMGASHNTLIAPAPVKSDKPKTHEGGWSLPE